LTGSAVVNTINGGVGGDVLIGGAAADVIDTGAANDNVLDIIRFLAQADYGDTVNNFDANGTTDRIEFGAALNALFDDLGNNDNFTFVSGNGANGGNTAANMNTAFEAMFLNGANGEGVTGGNLNSQADAAAIATEFNAEFNITAANGEQSLLLINDTDGNTASIWQWIQADGDTDNAIDAGELTFIALINANATVQTTGLDFV
jgi:hypothetical protein